MTHAFEILYAVLIGGAACAAALRPDGTWALWFLTAVLWLLFGFIVVAAAIGLTVLWRSFH